MMALNFASAINQFLKSLLVTGIGCLDPPSPPSALNLVPAAAIDVVTLISHKVVYRCKDDHFFHHDYHLKTMSFECMPTGRWDWTPIWNDWYCVHRLLRLCPKPPLPHPNGGLSSFNRARDKPLFDSQVTYSCEVGRKLQQLPGGPLTDNNITSTCQWDQTWTVQVRPKNTFCLLAIQVF